MLHRILWEANQDLARACLARPFVQGLADGSLSPVVFARYLAQDAVFLKAFTQAYALALARVDNLDDAADLRDLLNGAVDELKLHAQYGAVQAAPNPTCRAYTDFLLATAWHRPVGETVAALTPCMRLYAWLGARLGERRREDHPYRSWIDTYSSPDFERLAGRIEALLDRLASDAPEVRDRYRYAMQCELDFFEASR